jgi:Domain of unknown function (DUF892)
MARCLLIESQRFDALVPHSSSVRCRNLTLGQSDLAPHMPPRLAVETNHAAIRTDQQRKGGQPRPLEGPEGSPEETKNQILRLNQIFQKFDEKPQGVKCPAIDGLISERSRWRGC